MHRGVGCTVLPKNSMIKLCKSTLVFTPKLLKKPWPNLYSNFPKFDSVQCNIGGIFVVLITIKWLHFFHKKNIGRFFWGGHLTFEVDLQSGKYGTFQLMVVTWLVLTLTHVDEEHILYLRFASFPAS